MKYAIVEISGRQFWIETGKYYDLNRIPTELGKEIVFNRVLLLNNEGELLIGKPYLENVKICFSGADCFVVHEYWFCLVRSCN